MIKIQNILSEELQQKLQEVAFIQRYLEDPLYERRKRGTIFVLKAQVPPFVDFSQRSPIPVEATVVRTSETRWSRAYAPSQKEVGDFVILHFNKNNPLGNIACLKRGIVISKILVATEADAVAAKVLAELADGKVYKFAMQSASQARQGAALFMNAALSWKELVERMLGAFPEKELNLAKFNSYLGLSQSSTLPGCQARIKVVPDYEAHGIKYTDGMGLMSPAFARKLADILNLSWVPSAFQGRFFPNAGKGLWIVYPFPGWREVDLLVSQSQIKIDCGIREVFFEVCQWSKPRKPVGFFNYQFWQALSISAEELIAFAEAEFKRIEEMLDNPVQLAEYLGMHGDEVELDLTGKPIESSSYEDTLRSKVARILDACPEAIKDPWVRERVLKLVKSHLEDMRKGRIPVSGNYYFCAAEPVVLIDKPGLLKAGQAYLNGRTGSVAVFRSPLIHRSEASILELVNSPELEREYGKIRDVLILNCEDDVLPRAGGADCDGDIFFVTDDPVIISHVEQGLDMIETPSADAPKTKVTYKAVIQHVCDHIDPPKVGHITNLATTYMDMYRSGQMKELNDLRIRRLRELQGMAIDSVKTGARVVIPEDLETNLRPHWLEPKGRGLEVYHSTSPMGQLYDYVIERLSQMWDKACDILKAEDVLTGLSKVADLVEVEAILPEVEGLCKAYKSDLAALLRAREMYSGEEGVSPDFDDAVRRVFEYYTNALLRLQVKRGVSPESVALAAYYAAYARARDSKDKKQGMSFPWICAFDQILLALEKVPSGRFMLCRLYAPKWAKISKHVVVKDQVARDLDGNFVGVAKVKDGEYEVHFGMNGLPYVVVPNTRPVHTNTLTNRGYKIRFATGGVVENIQTILGSVGRKAAVKECTFNGKTRIGLFVNDKLVGLAVKESMTAAMFAIGTVTIKGAVPVTKDCNTITVTVEKAQA